MEGWGRRTLVDVGKVGAETGDWFEYCLSGRKVRELDSPNRKRGHLPERSIQCFDSLGI